MKSQLSTPPISRRPLRKIQKQSVTDDVESQLRDAILCGVLAPGELLAEAPLAAQLGVSRASVRQAKFQLTRDGLLELDERGTASVRMLTSSDAHEIIEFRRTLELGAARLACLRLDDQAVSALERNINQTEKEFELLKLTLLDIAFHEEIIKAAGNSRLMAAWKTLRPQLELCLAGMHRLDSAVTARTCEETVRGHRVLLQALKAGNPQAAERAMHEHTSGLPFYLMSEDQPKNVHPIQP